MMKQPSLFVQIINKIEVFIDRSAAIIVLIMDLDKLKMMVCFKVQANFN